MIPEKERGPVAVTTDPPCNAVGAIAGMAYGNTAWARNTQLADKTAGEQVIVRGELPGFTRPPIWEHPKRDGRLVAGEREYRGAHFFELRFWTGERGDKATGKGVTMPLEAVPGFARAMIAYAATLTPDAPDNGP